MNKLGKKKKGFLHLTNIARIIVLRSISKVLIRAKVLSKIDGRQRLVL